MILAEAGLRSELRHRRRRQRDRHGRALDRRRVVRGRGRRERRHPPRAAAAGTILTNVEADHLDHYGTFDAIVAGFDRYLAAGRRARRCSAPTTRSRAELAGPPRRRHLRHRRRRADYRAVDVGSAERGSCASPSSATATALGDGRAAAARRAQRAQRHSARRDGRCASASPFEARRARAGPLRRRGPPLRHPRRRTAASPSSTTTPTCPTEIAAVLAAAPRSGDGWRRVRRRVPAATATTAWPMLSPEYARRLRRCRRGRDHRHLRRRATAPIPGVTGKLRGRRRARRPPGAAGRRGCPGAADLVDYLAGELRAGDLCISMGCGDVASLPDEVLAAPGRAEGRSVSLPRRRRPRGRRSSGRWAAARRAARPADHLPGRRRRPPSLVRVDDGRRPRRRGRGARPRPALPVLVVGRGSNLLVADAGFAGVGRRARRAGFDEIDVDGHRRASPAAAVSLPGAGPPHRGGRAHRASSGRSACPARSAARCA